MWMCEPALMPVCHYTHTVPAFEQTLAWHFLTWSLLVLSRLCGFSTHTKDTQLSSLVSLQVWMLVFVLQWVQRQTDSHPPLSLFHLTSLQGSGEMKPASDWRRTWFCDSAFSLKYYLKLGHRSTWTNSIFVVKGQGQCDIMWDKSKLD